MSRTAKILLPLVAVAVALITAACGSQRIKVARQSGQPAGGALYHGAVLFNQRCAGCHTLSYAATFGSAPNIRNAQYNSGPNFDQRCERPITRILYAIFNGGFSGGVMPQNIVVGQDAVNVAKFVAQYSGRQAPHQSGTIKCQNQKVGTIPSSLLSQLSGQSGGTSQTSSLKIGRAPAKIAAAKPRARAKKHNS